MEDHILGETIGDEVQEINNRTAKKSDTKLKSEFEDTRVRYYKEISSMDWYSTHDFVLNKLKTQKC